MTVPQFIAEATRATAVLLCIVAPLVGSLLSPLKQTHRNFYRAFILAIPLANLGMLLACGPSPLAFSTGPFSFSLERFSFAFVVLLNACWALAIVYSYAFIAYQFQRQAVFFYRWFSVAISFVAATGMAANLFTAFFFYVATIPVVYPLVTIRGGLEAKTGGRWYLLSTLLPAFGIVLPALLWMNHWFAPLSSFSIRDVTTSDAAASLFLAALVIGFSKNCVAPFSGWLPRTSAAPAPVSALVHSVGAVHTGTITILKVVAYLYGADYAVHLSDQFMRTGWLLFLCGGTAVVTAYWAWRTTDLKKRFSYSTVGQLSYVLSAAILGSNNAIRGALFHIITHSVAKMTLFFVAGTYNSLYKTVRTDEIARLAPLTRSLVAVTGVCGLSIAGFPLLAGYYSKDLMLLEEWHHHHYSAVGFLLAGSLFNFLYIAPILRAGIFGRRDPTLKVEPVPVAIATALVLGTTGVLALSIAFGLFVD